MNTIKKMMIFGCALTVAFCLSLPAAMAAERISAAHGRITAIDTAHNCVVVDVPIGKKGMMTVGGPLGPKATVKKGGKSTVLENFKANEPVSIRWRRTADGPVILSLRER